MEEQHSEPKNEHSCTSRKPDKRMKRGTCCSPLQHGCRSSTSVKIFSAFFSVAAVFTSSIGMYVNSQVTTLERQFGFSSAQSGFIMSCNDIGFLVATLFISHQARRLHIPRSLSVSTIMFGVSGIVCSLAYIASPSFMTEGDSFIDGPVSNKTTVVIPKSNTKLCRNKSEINDCNSTESLLNSLHKVGGPTSFTPTALLILAIGMILQGIGKAPRQPFVTCYIDDNVEKTKTALYLGVIATVALLGHAIGFGAGGMFTKMFVTLEDVTITPADPRWIGAWWFGFVVLGFLSILAGVPLFFFPRRIKPKPQSASQEDVKFIKTMKELCLGLWKLLTNRMYMLLVLSMCVNLFVMSGYLAFLPKYFEVQYSVPVWTSNVIMGSMTLVAAGLGTMLGGIITSKYKLSPVACAKFITVLSFAAVFCPLTGMFLGCENPVIEGAIVNNEGTLKDSNSSCMDSCFCDNEDYFPVCGADRRNYFSPCHAGCMTKNNKKFMNCACIKTNGTATPGLCPAECRSMLYPFVTVAMLGGFLFTLTSIPALIFSIRCVSDKDKSLAVGLSTFLQTLLGWFPSPVVLGKVVDTSCLVWTSSCHGKGACVMYDIEDFRYKRHAIELGSKLLVLFMHIVMYRYAMKTDWNLQSTVNSSAAEEEILIASNRIRSRIDTPVVAYRDKLDKQEHQLLKI